MILGTKSYGLTAACAGAVDSGDVTPTNVGLQSLVSWVTAGALANGLGG